MRKKFVTHSTRKKIHRLTAEGRTPPDPQTGYSSSELDGYDSLFAIIASRLGESPGLTGDERRTRAIRESYREQTRWRGSIAQFRKMLELEFDFHIFQPWRLQPAINPGLQQHARVPRPVESHQPTTRSEIAKPTSPRIHGKSGSPQPDSDIQRFRLRERIDSLKKEQRVLYAKLKNHKLNPRYRGVCLGQKAIVEAELDLCYLQSRQPERYWKKLQNHESIRARNLSREQILEIPNLQTLLEVVTTASEAGTRLERELARISVTENHSSETKELFRSISKETEELRFSVDCLRREISPPPQEEKIFVDFVDP